MSAGDHLGTQFATMPTEELVKLWDPNMKDPETTYQWDKAYMDRTLIPDIRKHGIRTPVELDVWKHTNEPYLYEGHHRVTAALKLGIKDVPYKWRTDPNRLQPPKRL